MKKSIIPTLVLALAISVPAFGQIGSLVGRYLDNAGPTRIRDVFVAPEVDRIFAPPASTSTVFLGWRLSTFAADVDANAQALMPPVVSVDPTDPSQGWSYLAIDSTPFWSFDYDTRGYIYLSYNSNGFGIVNSAGQLQAQVNTEATHEIKLLPSGGRYYLAVETASGVMRVYDVTNPSAPSLVRTVPLVFTQMAVIGNTVAVVTAADLRIYDVDTLLNGGAAQQTFSGAYNYVVTDGTHFFATGQNSLATLTLTGGTWTPSTITYSGRLVRNLHWGGGSLTVTLVETDAPPNASGIIYTIENGAPVAHDITPDLQAIYPSAVPDALNVFVNGGQHYLITSLRTVGEVYGLAAAMFPAAATAIPDAPALSQWALLFVAIVLGGIAAVRLRG